jgi:ABC-2 type transport system permease protein
MYYLRLIASFLRLSAQGEAAYRANFYVSMLNSLLNFATGVLGVVVLFGQVRTVHGWSFPQSLALLGVYLILSALRGLFIGPSLNVLAGLDGEIWKGTFDFTMLRPINIQFLVSFRYWRPFALIDLALGVGVLGLALEQLRQALNLWNIIAFVLTLGAGVVVLYAILLAFAGLVFWSNGFLFTWVFDGLFQMARYPLALYPGWVRLVLTWIVPVGIMTTIPAQAISGKLSMGMLIGSIVVALVMLSGASFLFNIAIRRYASASS